MGYEEVKKTWQEKKIKDENDLKIALSNFQILFAYNSNKIENPFSFPNDLSILEFNNINFTNVKHSKNLLFILFNL